MYRWIGSAVFFSCSYHMMVVKIYGHYHYSLTRTIYLIIESLDIFLFSDVFEGCKFERACTEYSNEWFFFPCSCRLIGWITFNLFFSSFCVHFIFRCFCAFVAYFGQLFSQRTGAGHLKTTNIIFSNGGVDVSTYEFFFYRIVLLICVRDNYLFMWRMMCNDTIKLIKYVDMKRIDIIIYISPHVTIIFNEDN